MQIKPISAPAQINSPKLSPTDQMEQAFLEEMLKYTLPKPTSGQFSGGHGEEQFFTFLTREYAGLMATRLDLNLKVIK